MAFEIHLQQVIGSFVFKALPSRLRISPIVLAAGTSVSVHCKTLRIFRAFHSG
jgi:hypothetical protein